MKYLIATFLLFAGATLARAQKELVIDNGTVSYVSSQNVYVKFAATEHINKGDTLFIQQGDQVKPALLVKDKSSTSCVCSALILDKFKLGDAIVARSWVAKKQEKPKEKKAKTLPAAVDSTGKPSPVVIVPEAKGEGAVVYKQKINGRVSAASYSNAYGDELTHRMRYTFTLQGNHLKNGKLSTDTYLSFRHTLGEWDAVQANLSDALKVYALSVKYDIDPTSSFAIGRKINYHISSIGAIDGVQYEKTVKKHFLLGGVGGWRPDYADYGFNPNLFQAGAYAGYTSGKNNKTQESTVAVINQLNHSNVDRRFVYLQHTNNLAKDLNVFASMEVDLYQVVDSVVTHKPSLTNMLVSLRYRVSSKLSLNGSYDNRKNIIYYESYKNYIDQLIEDETRQGLRFGVNYRLAKMITWGANTSWRFQKSDLNLSKNLNSYLNFNRIPWIGGFGSLSVNLLETNYINSKMYGARLTREIVKGKLQIEGNYRWVDYTYKNYENKVRQQIAGLDLSWYITRKLGLYLSYEGTFDKQHKTFTRFNTRIIQRF